MDAPKPRRARVSRTELDFLYRLLLDLQHRLSDPVGGQPGDDAHVAALELALALLRWDGRPPPGHELQVGLGAAVETRLGADAMCAYRQWRAERRKLPAPVI